MLEQKEEQLTGNITQFLEKTGQDFDSYYKKYKPKLVRFLIGIGKDEDDAEDVATEAFVTSVKKIESYDPTKAVFSTWLFTIAKRIMIQKAREKSKFTSIDMDYEEGFSVGETLSYDDTDYETGHAINYQKSKSIKQIIPTLPEKYATVLTMRHINNKSYQDIAEELGYLIITVDGKDEKKIADIEEKLSHKKLAYRTSTFNKQMTGGKEDRKCKFMFALQYDANLGGFILFKGSETVKTFDEIQEFFRKHLGVDEVTRYALNLNTVKSRIRQARLLLYRLTKDDFQKLDNLDAEHVDVNAVYDEMLEEANF